MTFGEARCRPVNVSIHREFRRQQAVFRTECLLLLRSTVTRVREQTAVRGGSSRLLGIQYPLERDVIVTDRPTDRPMQ